ncbi:hypothetical protein [Streptomyces sp. Ag109_G2-15]|uniref:hypothetical protein n=1 Tax=Streptomyces sp. Ag109_G2-15 TaxID=1938850 RepID=UPI000BC8E66C|nr:hypothetical protein [Streptomyces sp. Ag109_G2-15]SOE06533.1 hypothetical protein SAMN06272765_7360 [Streptomyces sp. Ag109_G2-15]
MDDELMQDFDQEPARREPAVGDAHRAGALRGHLRDKDLEGLRTGYDPFGRLVLRNPTTGTVAVERPRALPANPGRGELSPQIALRSSHYGL